MLPGMTRDVRLVQTCYPQIYLACHTTHRERSSHALISTRDSSLLAHLDERRPTTPSVLAKHLGIGKPALSAAIKRLVRLGYIEVERSARDRRVTHLRLASSGAQAMSGSSVLDADRVRRLLRSLGPRERRAALDGLVSLARAARQIRQEEHHA